MALDFKGDALKQKQQATWAAGDYQKIASLVVSEAELLVERMDLVAGSRVIDLASGTGNAALAAARRNAEVTATDFVPALLDHAAKRAAVEELKIACRPADCENLPFNDGAFDAAISSFGVMFAPNHEQTARELRRVVRDGGKIGMANWTPDGFIGQLLKTVGRHLPPPAGLQPPVLWGTEAHLRALFPEDKIEISERDFIFRFASADAWVDYFRAYYGPTNRAFAVLEDDGAKALRQDIVDLLNAGNTSTDYLRVPSRYLEIVITT